MTGRLILILGDQLSPQISSLAAANQNDDVVLMAEVQEEASYVPHHKKKIAFVFSAMRHFAQELKRLGWAVDYVRLDDPDNSGTLRGEVIRALERHDRKSCLITEPGEWRLLEEMRNWPSAELLPDRRFIADRHGFVSWAEQQKSLRMEHFYRLMRRKTGLLMDGDRPAGGRWNFDADNRKPPKLDRPMPEPLRFTPDTVTAEVLQLVETRFSNNFGNLEPFWFATTRDQADQAFQHFLREALPDFGAFQDAMLRNSKFLYHSVISGYLNAGLLHPMQVCRAVEEEWRAGRVPLNSAEGFIRQIIGWREYVRCVYWWRMPRYAAQNALGAHRSLPDFYWTGRTPMACVSACVHQTREEAYAHHIQRLMITGNFALLAGIDPGELHEWYLAVYADAYEWVELPNTIGMSQFADGGLLASKPYAASGAYINRMSDYCKSCAFDVKVREGANACPFNLLYWDFIARHHDRLARNPRMSQIVHLWDRFPPEKQDRLRTDAAKFLGTLT